MAPYLLNPVLRVLRNPRFWLIVGLFVVGIILHYPQQLPFWGWEAPSSFLGLTRHTIERVYLLVPIIYAGFAFGIKGGIASLVVALGVMLPRAILISPSPADALFETGGVIGIGAAVNLLFQMHRGEQERIRVTDALLKAEEEKWRSSFNALEDVMLIIDRDYNIENINDNGLALLGKSREEVIGEKCYKIISGTDCPWEECPCRRTLETKQVESVERYEERFGRYFSIKSSPIFDESGEIVKFVDLRRDISEQKRAEHKLKERVKELQCLYSIANIVERPGITLDRLYQEIANLLPAAWQYPEITCARIAIDDNKFKTENYRETEWKQSSDIKVHGERAGVLEVSYLEESPEIDEGPFLKEERLLIEAVAERLGEITERKKAEEALQESERSYRELFEVAPDAIWVHDLKGNIIKANKATEKLTGFSAEELAKGNVKTLLSEEGLRLAKEVRRRLVKGEAVAQPCEQHLIRKDGTEATLMLTTSPIFSNGQLIAFQNIARDITEEKRMQENLRYYLQEIARAQEEERKRIARELHDSTAQTLIALLHQLENLLGDKAKLPVREAKALWGFYEQIRDVLREVRRFSRDLRPSILDDLGLLPALEWVTGELNKEYGVETTLKVVGSVRRFSQEAELILFRIVQEALRNIAKHAQASKAEVKVEFEKQKTRVTISDDGIGFQLPKSLGDLPHMGKLGLAGMQERVQLLGGNLKLKSKVGKGTTVVAVAPI